MTYVVTGRCLNCKYTDCVEQCPVDCFREGSNMLYIDPDVCINCSLCIELCPVQAIFPDHDVPEMYKDYIKINEEQSKNFPEITRDQKKDPLPIAKTLDQILEHEKIHGPIKHDIN